MGRTLPSTTNLVLKEFSELESLYRALRRSDQLILDKFFEDVLQHRTAIAVAKNLLPMETMPFVVLLEECKRNNALFIELFNQIDELEKRLLLLLPPEELELGGF